MSELELKVCELDARAAVEESEGYGDGLAEELWGTCSTETKLPSLFEPPGTRTTISCYWIFHSVVSSRNAE